MNKKIKSLEGLRAVMALVIFLSHASFLRYTFPCLEIYEKYFDNGGYAVAFFFILSGFVITLNYGDKFETVTKDNYLAFMKKRLMKIYPIYMLTMVWAAVYNIVVDGENILVVLVKLVISSTMLQSVIPGNGTMLNSAAWFVSCIMVMYILTPWLLKVVKNIRDRKKLIVCMIDCVVIVVAVDVIFSVGVMNRTMSSGAAVALTYSWPPYRLLYYLFGMFLGKLVADGKKNDDKRNADMGAADKKKKTSLGTILEIGAVLALVAGYFLTMGTTEVSSILDKSIGTYGFVFSMFKGIVTLPVIAFVIYTFANEDGVLSAFFGSKLMVGLGSASLDFYLIHYVIIWKSVSHILFSFLHVTDANLWTVFAVDLAMSFLVTGLVRLLRVKIGGKLSKRF